MDVHALNNWVIAFVFMTLLFMFVMILGVGFQPRIPTQSHTWVQLLTFGAVGVSSIMLAVTSGLLIYLQ